MIIDCPLESNQIYLRSLELSDATITYASWLSDPEVLKYLEVRFSPPQTPDLLKKFITQCNISADVLLLGIFLNNDRRHIGNIKLGPVDWNHKSADIGLLVGEKSEWGKGLASMAISLVTDYAFSHLRLCKLTASCYADNEGSLKAFLRAGYAMEGRRRSQWQAGNDRQDSLLIGKINPVLRPTPAE